MLSRLLLDDGNGASNSGAGGGLGGFVQGKKSLVYLQRVGFYSEGTKGCLQYGYVVVVDVFIESNLSSSLSISTNSLFLSTIRVGNWGVDPGRVSFTMTA